MNNFDVIIAGGGVMGCATAYNLLKRNPSLKVAIVERDSGYQKSSTVLSDGNTRVQFNLPQNIEISKYALEVLATFEEDMATDAYKPSLHFRQQGDLFILSESSIEGARQGFATQTELGCDVQWLEPSEVPGLFPPFNPDSCVGATFGPKDGTMSPLDVLRGYRYKSIEMGATPIEASVATFQKEGNQITGVTLATGETLSAPIVLNTAGVWATALAQTVGVELPMKSIKRQVYSVESDISFDYTLPMLLLPTGQYVLHEGNNTFITGGALPDDPETEDDFSYDITRFEGRLWEQLIDFIPAFDKLKVVQGWAGLYAVNHFDGNAILGEWPELTGLFMANGFSGHGFQQCHGVGRYLAECILGDTPALDLSLFSPQRILDNTPVFENPSRII